ncbi:MAG: DUF3168 domain-containing protein [Planctomycetes bacterium]|nr:DUF3168 domain-containing protein [Planctomycetota bacterium]
MTLGKYLRMVLTADARVAALAADRVYTEVLPQAGTVPAIVFTEVSGDEDYALDGPTGTSARRVQVDSWAKARADATALGLAVKAALSGHTGAAAGLDVQGVFLVAERWDFDAESALYRTSQDFDVWTAGDAA